MQETELEKLDFVRVVNLHHDMIPNERIDGYNCDFGPQGSGEASRDLPREVAEKLVARWPNQLFILGEGKATDYDAPNTSDGEQYKYLANVTGNPDEPEFITVELNRDKEGRVVPSKEKNMRRDPKIVREFIGGGHSAWQSPDGTWNQQTFPKKQYVIPPMQRVRLPKHVADAILYKDLRNMPWIRGSVIESRPEQPGEPKMSWTIDELRYYGLYIFGELRGKVMFPETAADVRKRLIEKEGLSEDDEEFLAKMMNVKASYHSKLMAKVLRKDQPLPSVATFQAFVKKEEEKAKRKAEFAAKSKN